MPTIRLITLGCAKNEVDSEEIAGVLATRGHKVDASKSPDVTIINTCGFLEAAKQESLETIRKSIRTKGAGKVVVAGCLVQRMGQDLVIQTPGADAYIGVGQMARFGEIVEKILASPNPYIELEAPYHRWAEVETRARHDKPWSAYLKISEGCDHKCTFCTIPSFRGKHQSKPIERVLAEAKHLARTGARELNLIAQDVTQYGYDLYKEFTLPKLLDELNKVEGIEWIRLLYFYPNRLTDEVIDAIATNEKVLPYIDIPLQHVHPETLRRMKRPWDGERYLELFLKVRRAIPQVAIRTTFIVGFPGETDAEFKSMIDFVNEAQLDRVGAFLFSREPGTPSYDMPNQVPTKIKKQRFDRLMTTQRGISLARNKEFVGQKLDVLIDHTENGWSIGRSYRDAPEIDGFVYVQGEVSPGSIQKVDVQGYTEYDLLGAPAGTVFTRTNLSPLRLQPAQPR